MTWRITSAERVRALPCDKGVETFRQVVMENAGWASLRSSDDPADSPTPRVSRQQSISCDDLAVQGRLTCRVAGGPVARHLTQVQEELVSPRLSSIQLDTLQTIANHEGAAALVAHMRLDISCSQCGPPPRRLT